MPVRWELRDRLMVITIIGQGGEDPRVTIMNAIGSPQFKPGTSILFDVRLATDNPTSDELRSRAKWLSMFRPKGISSRCAIVVGPRAYQFGLARMACAHLEFEGMCMEIFRHMDEAERWLSSTAGRG